MKTLAQIEARTPVDATNTPGNANAQYVITQPGSYYLTGNLVGATNGSAGILIQATDVVLDLNGFELLAPAILATQSASAVLAPGISSSVMVACATGSLGSLVISATMVNWTTCGFMAV